MLQKCSLWKVFNIFVEEPTKIHYIKSISKKINLAPTSVKLHIKRLLNEGFIIRKKGERATGYIANRDNKKFCFYKKIGNLILLEESGLTEHIINSLYPITIMLYGSYSKGEDIESSDIDLFIISKIKKNIEIQKFEQLLKRGIHLIIQENLKKISESMKLEIINGTILYGYFKEK